MDPRDFVAFASNLVDCDTGPDAARNRTVIGRAYYAGWLVAKDFLASLPIVIPRTKDAHTYVPRLLRYSSDQDLALAATTLDTLRGRRHRADYELNRLGTETKNVAEDAIDEARDVIIAIDGCADPARRRLIIDRITETRSRLGE